MIILTRDKAILEQLVKTGIISDIQEFAIHDGPGIRMTVFVKGCPLRCTWCHNPESLSPEPQSIQSGDGTRLVGRLYTSAELAERIKRQADILTFSGGGVTFSGGEVLAQADFVLETLAAIPGVHTIVDTSGYGRPEHFRALAEASSLVFFGLKIADPTLHRQFTGVDNRLILDNLAVMKTLPTPFVARIPLIPGVTDTDANFTALAALLAGAPNLQRVDLLPYNPAAGGKYRACGMEFRPGFDEKQPLNFNQHPFEQAGLPVTIV